MFCFSSNQNCLLHHSVPKEGDFRKVYLDEKPGQYFNLNEQCQKIYGTDSYFCGVIHWKHVTTFSVKRNTPWKVAFLFGKSVDRWTLYQICIDCNAIWAVLRIPKHDIPLDFSRYQENHLTFLNGGFCDLFQIPLIKYDPAEVTWTWPWVTGEAKIFMVRFFWDWV